MGVIVRSWAAALAGMTALAAGHACQALAPDRDINQLHHTAWTIEAGAPADVWALAQTPDGFLWLGTGSGLVRFDGVRFEKVQLAGDRLSSNNVNSLFVDHSGDLWIGYSNGQIAVLRNGRLRNLSAGLPGGDVYQIIEDPQRRIWAAIYGAVDGGLAELIDGRWRTVGPEHGLGPGGVSSVLASRDGALWVATDRELFVRRPGSVRFAATGQKLLVDTALAQAPDGRIWISKSGRGPRPLPDLQSGASPKFVPKIAAGGDAYDADHIFFDRDGSLWASSPGGLLRLPGASSAKADAPLNPARFERYSLADGLSSNIAEPLIEDREGDVWLGTNLGLDRFRAANVVAVKGLPVTASAGYRIAAATAGGMFVASGRDLYLARPNAKARLITTVPEDAKFLASDKDGAIWLGTTSGLLAVDGSEVRRVALPPTARGAIRSWMEDLSGSIWFASPAGIFRRRDGRWGQVAPPGRLPCPVASQMATDARGRSWLLCQGRLAELRPSGARQVSERDGLQTGDVQIIFTGRQETLFAGDFGIARFDGHAFQTLGSDRFSVLGRVSGIVQTASGDTWLNGIAGVVRVKTRSLDAAFADAKLPLPYELFTLSDGLPGVAQQDSQQPTALGASDGRLWFITNHGVAWIDPATLRHNPLPPPVVIRSITANGVVHPPGARLTLPAGTSSLQFDFTALSLPIPERVRFQYQLEGVDDGWINAGPRRQAFYTNLKPGDYTFQVMAANNDGLWNPVSAAMHVDIPPTFMQSYWFLGMLLAAALAGLWALYLIRLRYVTDSIRGRLEERLNERERIARELHDTLLQGFQGLVLRFQAAAEGIEPAQAARKLMDDALVRADQALVEGRNRILNLRSHHNPSGLSEAFTKAAEALAIGPGVTFRVLVEGDPRTLTPEVADDVLRIGEEALFNAVRHSRCRNIDVHLSYGLRELLVSVRDDGIGIDPDILHRGSRQGHFGFVGMRERAARIKARFSIASRTGEGAEITLAVAARHAYATSARQRGLRPWSIRARGRDRHD